VNRAHGTKQTETKRKNIREKKLQHVINFSLRFARSFILALEVFGWKITTKKREKLKKLNVQSILFCG
jgi:hypothetical protein